MEDLSTFTWNHLQLDNKKENRTNILKEICKPRDLLYSVSLQHRREENNDTLK